MKAAYISLAIAAALLVSAQADTLTKRDGSSLAGTWLGYQNDTVKFQINGQAMAYPRSEVSSVLFGAGPAQQSLIRIPEPRAHAENTAIGQVPEFIGAVYLRDSTGALVPLEKTEAKAKFYKLRSNSVQIAGAKSNVRIKSGARMLFVVRLANGVDPASMTLHVLVSTKDARRVETDPDQKNDAYLTISVNVTRVSDSTYGLSPARELKPGEYAFSPQGMNTGYCFGIDPAGQQ